MEYIRTKDGIYRHALIGMNHYKYIGCETSYGEMHGDDWSLILEKEIIKQADSVDELVDEFLFVDKNFHENDGRGKIRMRSLPRVLKKIEYLKRKLKDFYREEDYVVFGTIWVNDELRKVAKMNSDRRMELL